MSEKKSKAASRARDKYANDAEYREKHKKKVRDKKRLAKNPNTKPVHLTIMDKELRDIEDCLSSKIVDSKYDCEESLKWYSTLKGADRFEYCALFKGIIRTFYQLMLNPRISSVKKEDLDEIFKIVRLAVMISERDEIFPFVKPLTVDEFTEISTARKQFF